jgi:hypothetical protein
MSPLVQDSDPAIPNLTIQRKMRGFERNCRAVLRVQHGIDTAQVIAKAAKNGICQALLLGNPFRTVEMRPCARTQARGKLRYRKGSSALLVKADLVG